MENIRFIDLIISSVAWPEAVIMGLLLSQDLNYAVVIIKLMC